MLIVSGLVVALLAGYWLYAQAAAPGGGRRGIAGGPKLADIPFDGQRSLGYLQQICALGPRPSGSQGMLAQQKLMAEHFGKLGGKVSMQPFRYRHPLDGSTVAMSNMIVQWHPERKQRILLCAHYDTRPFPDRDPVNPRGKFIGANDGASGVALLMEMAHYMPDLEGNYGVDFVFFDGEEFVFNDNDAYFLGAEYFSRSYVADPPAHRYRWGVLFDMVADADLQIYQEGNSVWWPDTRPLVEAIWQTADRLEVPNFVARKGQEIRDDHLKLRNIAKIPTCDIIDFDYPYWHTTDDSPRRCSADSLAKVGWVALEWLRGLK
jgi:hypothetical protein